MLTRRELLTKGTTALLVVPILSCSGSSSSSPPACEVGSLAFLSSVDADHNHILCVQTSDLASPPSQVTYTTTTDGGHSHKIVLTQSQLLSINSGQTIMAESTTDLDPTNNENHSHMYMIAKATGTTGGGDDLPTGW